MEAATYQKWWPLHTKRAQGHALTAEEQAVYEAGRRELEGEECLPSDMEELRGLRSEIAELEAKRSSLSEERRVLRERIARLEAHLPDEMKQALGVGN